MTFLSDEVRDQGLDYLDANGTRIDICSQEPATYAEATTTYTLGNKTGLNTGAPEDGDSEGRKVVVPAVTDGSVTGNGTATHWALTNGADELLATGALSSSQVVTSGNTFTLSAIDITINDAA
ncbi:hypothetical protein [Psychromarinibacter halotolerans]|uniref:Bacteriophage lambda head decoration protein D n=1 Tax=Psychromarinibacter halotolerans TaxID=1775175 RepID=A0ABV7H0P9_9RHOB|nr:hypothetical protein [Psychromarinibacter halotolerans]MDF0598448.1 hypothetical protein [Psychromarinibacter halotolerans]